MYNSRARSPQGGEFNCIAVSFAFLVLSLYESHNNGVGPHGLIAVDRKGRGDIEISHLHFHTLRLATGRGAALAPV